MIDNPSERSRPPFVVHEDFLDYVDTSSPQQTHTERSGEAQAATTRPLT